MSEDNSRPQCQALIAEIVSTYHEAHRRDLPTLLALSQGLDNAVLAHGFSALRELLEMHMFKEEMRTFPMLQQGSSALLGELADNMMSEHDLIRARVDELQQCLAALSAQDTRPLLAQLMGEAGRFFEQLEEHARIEDEQLFGPLLARRSSTPIA